MFNQTHPLQHFEIPEPYRSIMNMVSDDDREYFLKNPNLTERIRPYVPGEFYLEQHPSGTMVRVSKWTSDFRKRVVIIDD